jgi:hypothetical protein
MAGPVVVEVDGSAEGLRVIDYACAEAIRDAAGLLTRNGSRNVTSIDEYLRFCASSGRSER